MVMRLPQDPMMTCMDYCKFRNEERMVRAENGTQAKRDWKERLRVQARERKI